MGVARDHEGIFDEQVVTMLIVRHILIRGVAEGQGVREHDPAVPLRAGERGGENKFVK